MTKGERVAFSYGRSSCVSGTLMAPAYDGRMRTLVSESRIERGIRSNVRNMAAWYIGYAFQGRYCGKGYYAGTVSGHDDRCYTMRFAR